MTRSYFLPHPRTTRIAFIFLLLSSYSLTIFGGAFGISGGIFGAPSSPAINTGRNLDGKGTAARFNQPLGIATDSSDNIYVADGLNHTIRKISPTGVVTTLAGTAGLAGYTNDKGAAARFKRPTSVTTDSSGNIYVADSFNDAIRKINPSGVVTTLAGKPPNPFSRGGVDGVGQSAGFTNPGGVATDNAGNIYVADSNNDTIRKITTAGDVTTLAGKSVLGVADHTDGTGPAARFSLPRGIATDTAGNVYVADSNNNTIRKITPSSVVTTLAGKAGVTGHANGMAASASFNEPWGIAVDKAGNIFVAEAGNNSIRKINPAGVVTTLAGRAGEEGHADGTGAVARFNDPQGIATDTAGNVYVADTGNNIIRKITPAGVVTTVAGQAGKSNIP